MFFIYIGIHLYAFVIGNSYSILFLNVKLNYLDKWNAERNRIALRYLERINNPNVELPIVNPDNYHVWHLFVVRVKNREEFQNYLNSLGISTLIHYPTAIHKQKAYTEYNNYYRLYAQFRFSIH